MNGNCACASKATGRGGARYIRQQDDLRVHLTVYEAMSLAAALKLADFRASDRKEKVFVSIIYRKLTFIQSVKLLNVKAYINTI